MRKRFANGDWEDVNCPNLTGAKSDSDDRRGEHIQDSTEVEAPGLRQLEAVRAVKGPRPSSHEVVGAKGKWRVSRKIKPSWTSLVVRVNPRRAAPIKPRRRLRLTDITRRRAATHHAHCLLCCIALCFSFVDYAAQPRPAQPSPAQHRAVISASLGRTVKLGPPRREGIVTGVPEVAYGSVPAGRHRRTSPRPPSLGVSSHDSLPDPEPTHTRSTRTHTPNV